MRTSRHEAAQGRDFFFTLASFLGFSFLSDDAIVDLTADNCSERLAFGTVSRKNSSGSFGEERHSEGLCACFTAAFGAGSNHRLPRLTAQVPDNNSVTHSHPFFSCRGL